MRPHQFARPIERQRRDSGNFLILQCSSLCLPAASPVSVEQPPDPKGFGWFRRVQPIIRIFNCSVAKKVLSHKIFQALTNSWSLNKFSIVSTVEKVEQTVTRLVFPRVSEFSRFASYAPREMGRGKWSGTRKRASWTKLVSEALPIFKRCAANAFRENPCQPPILGAFNSPAAIHSGCARKTFCASGTKANPHPSLHFKPSAQYWSARIGASSSSRPRVLKGKHGI